jgi:hypothetical protein
VRPRSLRVAAATLVTGVLAVAGSAIMADAAGAQGAVSDPVTRGTKPPSPTAPCAAEA